MVEIYAVKLEVQLEDSLFHSLLDCVDVGKKERILRYRRWKDAHRSLYGDLLVRHIIQQKMKIQNYNISFSLNEYKKPLLNHIPNFHFNISHSGCWIVCAVDEMTVGVDVETVRPVDLKISRRFYSEEEDQILMSKPENEQEEFFFTLWSLKESYIKILGKGLYHPLNSFTIKFLEDGQIKLFLKDEMISDIYFKMYDFGSDYKMAACAHTNHFAEQVIYKKIDEITEFFLH